MSWTMIAGAHVAQGAGLEALEHIVQPEVNLAIWTRTMGDDLVADVERALLDAMPAFDGASPADANLVQWMRADSALASYPALCADASILARLLARLTQAGLVRIRLGPVSKQECPVFHSDTVGLRLICTYSGRGTEWLRNEDVQRDRMGCYDGCSCDDANQRTLRAGAAVNALGTGHVGLFKGSAWPGNAGNGIVHRSPELESCFTPRLRLVVDAADDFDG